MGDGMGVGTAIFGAPRFCTFLWKNAVLSRVLVKNRGCPKNGRSNHHPSHPPLDVLLDMCDKERREKSRTPRGKPAITCSFDGMYRGTWCDPIMTSNKHNDTVVL